MTSPLSFFSFISGLLSEANDGLNQALDASKDQSVVFVIPRMDMQLKCIVVDDGGIKVVPSSAEGSNYYGENGVSELKLTFKLKHR